jgi:CRP-like cAMP-binding protein
MASILKYCFGLPEVAFEAGSQLIAEDGQRGPLFILVAGTVEVLRDGVAVAKADQPGSIFGEMSALLDVPHTATVRAVSDVRVHIINEADQFLESRPQIALAVARLLAHRLNDATTYLVEARNAHESGEYPLDVVSEIINSIAHGQGRAG